MPLITGKRLTDRYMREAYRAVYGSDLLTREGLRQQSDYRRALLRQVVRAWDKVTDPDPKF